MATERTVAKLKKKWSDLKAKRKLSSHHQSVAATGGGPSTADLTSVDNKIISKSFRSLKLWVNRRFTVRGSQMQMHTVRLKAVLLLRLARSKLVRYSLMQSYSYSQRQ
ncbi:myb-related transcription factor, partner of profilin-like [Tachysurus ichikawai]